MLELALMVEKKSPRRPCYVFAKLTKEEGEVF
jgi:hypothetical protein